MQKNRCIMQIWAETGKSALPIRNYSQILYQFLMFTQNLKRSRATTSPVLDYLFPDSPLAFLPIFIFNFAYHSLLRFFSKSLPKPLFYPYASLKMGKKIGQKLAIFWSNFRPQTTTSCGQTRLFLLFSTILHQNY